ncbi:TonB-dependent receptor plug domain-containing protein [Roseivirga sp. E12]|uniref:TonB-dependent receptor n=1 Tax=Roseivirga sp. E12 TaxID=2819237 RepID=UPI001ABD3949|nr:TonB-dependent receptor plug domain-containing protein [Roseivirga sp. E12]MBO3698736.1 TonB-dependent receptor [Roseivirga sp. E12]
MSKTTLILRSASVAIMLWLCSSLSAQEVIIKNESFEPLPGATLVMLPDSVVYVADPEGRITLNIQEPRSATISYVGYTTQNLLIRQGDNRVIILNRSNKVLSELVVEGFSGKQPLNRQSGGLAYITPGTFNRFDESSLVNAVNTVPGVRFEQRAGGSYRVSIRGSSIRSPFGVRNVKVYWNGIPFTEPGGNTFLNLLDLNNTAKLEIMKGPSASAFGAGNGGVMKIQSTDLSMLSNASLLSTSFGSFGAQKFSGVHNVLNENSSLTLKWSSQTSDGYREHNRLDRQTIELDGLFFPSDKRTISASILYSDLFYQIPGGLNPDQRAANPRQSRPNSIERNSSVGNEYFLFTVGQEYQISDSWSNKTNVGLSTSKFENPFILDYKRDNQQIFSLRSEFTNELSLGGKDLNMTYGIEYQKSFFDGKNFGNVDGQADTIRFADEVDIDQQLLFANFDYQLSESLGLTFGISLNSLSYRIDRTIDKINDNPQAFRKEFNEVWSPRLALSQTINDNYSVHFSVMSGFSPPTTTEVRTNEGSINLGLQAEKGTNYEVNFRGAAADKKLSFDLALFYFQLSDAITTFADGQGVVLFRNAGETSQKGLELSTRMDWLTDASGLVRSLSTSLAYTYHDFQFENYIDDGDDFSGMALPGTSPHVVNIQTDLVFRNGIYMNLTYHYSDPIPLNDANTFFSRAYNLVNLRAGYHGRLFNQDIELYGGVDNLFDVSYSLGNDLNAFGRRYFQPAATINYYFGLKVKLNH